jgi:thiol-disulfide isomerase/thioredoxin
MTQMSDPKPRRRRLLALGAGLSLGAGVLAHFLLNSTNTPSSTSKEAASGLKAPELLALRQMNWACLNDPSGLVKRPSDLRAGPLLVNFWATWCTPCIKEMPDLDRLRQAIRQESKSTSSLEIAGIGIDQEAKIRQFLQKTPVSYPIFLAGAEGLEFMKATGNAQGYLPFSLLFDRHDQLVKRLPGALDIPALETLIRQIM